MENNFANNLKQLRTINHIGQTELAQNLNVSKGIISMWENNLREPKLTHLIAIARYFKVSIDYLAGLED